MTKLASFEAGEGKKLLPTMTYFRSDYIGSQMLKSFIAGTVSLICIVAVYLFYNFEVIMADIYNIDYIATLKRAGIVYAVLMCIYLAIIYLVAVFRYNRAKNGVKKYMKALSVLEKM